MKSFVALAVVTIVMCSDPLRVQTPREELPMPDRTILLYDGIPAGSEHWDFEERTIFNPEVSLEFTQNVVRPALLYYAPDASKASGAAVIIAPGGGGVNLTIRYEGTDVAEQLSKAGVAVFVLKYRLVAHPVDSPLSKAYARDANHRVLDGPQKGQDIRALAIADATRAMRWVRENAAQFGLRADRVGFVGFSAGGFLACQLINGPVESRPDFIAPIYGPDRSIQPGPDAPPAFFATALDDKWTVDDTLALFAAWREAKRPAELHVFQTGGHGFLTKGGGGDHVVDRLEEWMRGNGWLTK